MKQFFSAHKLLISLMVSIVSLGVATTSILIPGPPGQDGNDGVNGQEVTFRIAGDYLQFGYVGEDTFTNLVLLDELKGVAGVSADNIVLDVNDTHITWQYQDSEVVFNLIPLSALMGLPGNHGLNVELQTVDDYIVWRYEGTSTWTNLVALELLKGPKGEDGNDVELQVSDTHIQWRYTGDTTWFNLLPLSDLKGTDGVSILSVNVETVVEEIETFLSFNTASMIESTNVSNDVHELQKIFDVYNPNADVYYSGFGNNNESLNHPSDGNTYGYEFYMFQGVIDEDVEFGLVYFEDDTFPTVRFYVTYEVDFIEYEIYANTYGYQGYRYNDVYDMTPVIDEDYEKTIIIPKGSQNVLIQMVTEDINYDYDLGYRIVTDYPFESFKSKEVAYAHAILPNTYEQHVLRFILSDEEDETIFNSHRYHLLVSTKEDILFEGYDVDLFDLADLNLGEGTLYIESDFDGEHNHVVTLSGTLDEVIFIYIVKTSEERFSMIVQQFDLETEEFNNVGSVSRRSYSKIPEEAQVMDITLNDGTTFTFKFSVEGIEFRMNDEAYITLIEGDLLRGRDGQDGSTGDDGENGLTPYIGDNGNWFIGDNDTGVLAQLKSDIVYIETVDDFLNMGNCLNCDYVLLKNLDFKDVSMTPIGSINDPFTGSFDGNGYTLSSLSLVFQNVANATFKNIKIQLTNQDANLVGTSFWAYEVFGTVTFESIEIETEGDLNLQYGSALLVSKITHGNIEFKDIQISNFANTSLSFDSALLIGEVSNANITFSDIDVYTNNTTFGHSSALLMGSLNLSQIELHDVKMSQNVGVVIGTKNGLVIGETENSEILSNRVILSNAQLQFLQSARFFGMFAGYTLQLRATIEDINIKGMYIADDLWYAGGLFGAMYHSRTVIEDLYIGDKTAISQSPFTITGTQHSGGIVGHLDNSNIHVIQVEGSLIATSSINANGGLIGSAYQTSDLNQVIILDEINLDVRNFTGLETFGGLIGEVLGYQVYISDTQVIGEIRTDQYVGGLIGKIIQSITIDENTMYRTSNVQINRVNMYMDINVLLGYVGGLIGYIEAPIYQNYLTDIYSDDKWILNDEITSMLPTQVNMYDINMYSTIYSGGDNYGGFIGYQMGAISTFSRVFYYGSLYSPNQLHAGGLIGFTVSSFVKVDLTYMYGMMSAKDYLGGLVGSVKGSGIFIVSNTLIDVLSAYVTEVNSLNIGEIYGAMDFFVYSNINKVIQRSNDLPDHS